MPTMDLSHMVSANLEFYYYNRSWGGDIVLSAYSILGKMRSSGDDSLIRLAKAVYLYGASANTYFG